MEQEMLKQILDGINELNKKHDKIELDLKRLEKKVDKNHKQVIDELNLHGRYILEDVKRVDNKLNRVVEKNKLSVG